MRAHHQLLRGFFAAGLGGLMFCCPATGFSQTQFKIESLTPNNASVVDVDSVIGDDRSGIAVSTSNVFLTGDDGTGSWSRSDLSGGTNVGFTYDAIVMDLHTEKVYTLATAAGAPIGDSGGTVAKLIELDPVTGALTSNEIPLSMPFTVSANTFEAGLFSGYDRIVVVDGNNVDNAPAGASAAPVYNIELPGGTVTQIGTITAPEYFDRQYAENWTTWGVAEFSDGDVSLVYVADQNRIDRVNVTSNAVENVADFTPQDVYDSACFTVLPSLNRWYFHYEGGTPTSIGGGTPNETLGFADATFLIRNTPELSNISTRASVGTGEMVEIPGFIIQTASDGADVVIRGDGRVISESAPAGNVAPEGSKRVLIRGLGPSLESQFGSTIATLPDPVLELYNGNGNEIAYNNNWRDTQESTIEATGLAPTNDLEAAMVVTLTSNSSYTAFLHDKNGATGIGMVEVYDLQQGSGTNLLNISTRGFVSTGDDVLIGGIILSTGSEDIPRIVVRAIGPSMTALGVQNALADPTLELFDANGMSLAMNDNWMDSPDMQEISDAGLAPSDDLESAIIFTPMPGGMYTAIVRGKNETTGIGLVEAFRIPAAPAP